ncbi:MAG TPA: HD domain-containing protein [Solirubrobacteraceae bacterium]
MPDSTTPPALGPEQRAAAARLLAAAWPAAAELGEIFARHGHQLAIVGGSVRDVFLRRRSADLDLTTDARPERVMEITEKWADSTWPAGLAFGTVGLRKGPATIEITTYRSEEYDPGSRKPAVAFGRTLEGDLARRDFTINAMARPLAARDTTSLVDPFGGAADLAGARLRMVSAAALDADPLRTLRAARLACELALEIEPATAAAVRERAPALAGVAVERVFAELRRIVLAPYPVRGVRLAEELGVAAVVLPELGRMEGVGQGIYHHLDVHDHTLAVLEAVVALQADPEAVLGPATAATDAHLRAEVGDGFDGWGALRLAALLHDAAKPDTRTVFPGDRVGFPGHDVQGADLVLSILRRLRTSARLGAHVAALTQHHLRLGFLVHETPLDRRALDAYFRATEPVGVDVTVLTVADRLATRGRKADEAIARHLALAREVLAVAPEWEAARRAPPLVRGDKVARALGIAKGPRLGAALEELRTAHFAGEVSTPEEALEHLRGWTPA